MLPHQVGGQAPAPPRRCAAFTVFFPCPAGSLGAVMSIPKLKLVERIKFTTTVKYRTSPDLTFATLDGHSVTPLGREFLRS